ncbi:ankyrin repeat domain-containing protein 37 isoform X3 [Oryctolagus cuniculus]
METENQSFARDSSFPRGIKGLGTLCETCQTERVSWRPPEPHRSDSRPPRCRPSPRTRAAAPGGRTMAPPRGGWAFPSAAGESAGGSALAPPLSPSVSPGSGLHVAVFVLPGSLARVTADRPPGAAESASSGLEGLGSRKLFNPETAQDWRKGAGSVFSPQVDSLKHLLETGASVNAPPDPCEQSPVHLAAGGGLAHFLLWQLQTGADLNQQDVLGEAPLHKAARVGSLECLSLLVANDAQIDLCNKNGQTAEDLAWSCGFLECAKFLTTIKSMQTIKSNEQPNKDHCVPVLRQKRRFGNVECTNGKRKC